MKKLILLAAAALLFGMLPAQEQPQAQPEPQVQAPTPGLDLKKVTFPQAFIHAGKEYPAGDYWLVLEQKEERSFFSVRDAKKEMLFEELAIVKSRGGSRAGRGFRVKKQMMKDKEYFRVLVATGGQWLMGYFLVKK